MTETQRNFLILGLLALVGVMFSTGFNIGAGIVGYILNLLFTAAIIALIVVMYRRHSGTIALMPATPRLVLQLGTIMLGAALLLLMLPIYPIDTVLLFALLFASGFAIFWAWGQRTTGW